MGLSIISQKRYRESILWLLKGLEALRKSKVSNPSLEARLHGNLGTSYTEIKDYESALFHLNRLITISKENNFKRVINTYAQDYGALLIKMGKTVEGVQYIRTIIKKMSS